LRMRIFTGAERRVIKAFLEEDLKLESFRHLLFYIRRAKELKEDVDLLLRFVNELRKYGYALGPWTLDEHEGESYGM